MRPCSKSSLVSVLAAGLAASLLSGCSTSFAPNPIQTDQTSIGDIQGMVHGGQSPVTGAHIYLYAAGTGGYGASATSLLKLAANTLPDTSLHYYVTSDSTGSFSLSGDYTCTVGTQVYLVGVGGNSGTGSNAEIVQMAALGQCPASGTLAQQVPYVTMNEISTVAAAYALGGFGSTAYNISSSGTTLAQTGIANAFANVSNILNIATGQPYATAVGNTNSVVPQAKLITMANILASCVNTSDTIAGTTSTPSAGCTSLFKLATSDGTTNGTKPTDEGGAIFNIVHHPTANVATLYKLSPPTPAFSGGLSAQPIDWTMPIKYNGSFTYPFNIASDATGDEWIGDEQNGLYKISPLGKFTSVSVGTFGLLKGVAVAANGNIWVTDYNSNKLYIVAPTGTLSKTITTGGLNGPEAISFDTAGDAYVINQTSASISRYNSAGTALSAAAIVVPNVQQPAWLAIDNNDDTWVPSQQNDYVGELVSGKGTAKSYANRVQSYALAIDSANEVWVAGQNNELYQLSSTGATQHTYTGGGMNAPYTISVDGDGSLWMSNPTGTTVSGFSNAGAPLSAGGFATGTTGLCYSATPDISGNLWTANDDGSLTVLLGLAAPTAAPMVPGNLGVRP